jgi:hypothetical protein
MKLRALQLTRLRALQLAKLTRLRALQLAELRALQLKELRALQLTELSAPPPRVLLMYLALPVMQQIEPDEVRLCRSGNHDVRV